MELDFSKSMLDELRQFIFERFRTWASEQGIETNTFHAVNAGRLTTLADFMDRARAVQAFADDESVAGLIAANKRIKNLLEQAGETNFGDVDESSLQEDTEKHLFKEVAAAEKRFVPLCDDARYEAALAELAGLRDSVDAFFDGVMVMTEDATLRRARLALLARMRKLFTRIADVALLGR